MHLLVQPCHLTLHSMLLYAGSTLYSGGVLYAGGILHAGGILNSGLREACSTCA